MKTDKIYRLLKILEAVLKQNNILNKSQNTFNTDKSGIQLINKPKIVAAQKEVRDVHVLTAHDREENVAVIACSSSEEQFLPPIIILKGVNNKQAFGTVFPRDRKSK
jgi:peroxiredoxin family protein